MIWGEFERGSIMTVLILILIFVMNELGKNGSIDALYDDEDCIIMIETIDEKYTNIEDLILLVDGIIVKMRNNKNV